VCTWIHQHACMFRQDIMKSWAMSELLCIAVKFLELLHLPRVRYLITTFTAIPVWHVISSYRVPVQLSSSSSKSGAYPRLPPRLPPVGPKMLDLGAQKHPKTLLIRPILGRKPGLSASFTPTGRGARHVFGGKHVIWACSGSIFGLFHLLNLAIFRVLTPDDPWIALKVRSFAYIMR